MSFVLIALLMSAADPQAAAASEPKKKDPTVCRTSLVGSTGSRLRSPRVCKKQSEWDDLQRQTDKTVQVLNDKGGTSGARQEGAGVSPQ